jgi:succinate dehydrogenase / fumarate reductase membrane anchor subunit
MSTIPSQDGRFETIAWWYTRLSGILLILLLFGHLLIMHILNSAFGISYRWVITERWAFLGWRIYDACILWLGGLHALNGLRRVVNDYVHRPGLNYALKIVLVLLVAPLIILGTIVVTSAPTIPAPDM